MALSHSHRKAISLGLQRYHAKKGKWIKGAIKHPGALRAKAQRMGLAKPGKPLSKTAVKKLEHSKNPATRRQAFLAETLKRLRH